MAISAAIIKKIDDFINTPDAVNNVSVSELSKLPRTDTLIAFALEAQRDFAMAAMGEYFHPDETIQSFIRANLMELKWRSLLERLLQYIPYGFVCGIKIFTPDSPIRIDSIALLPQDAVEFKADAKGKYIEVSVKGGEKIRVEKADYFHLANQEFLVPGAVAPRGIAALGRIERIVKLHTIVMDCMAIASQRQATPFLVGKSTDDPILQFDDQGLPILNPDGSQKTLGKGEIMREEMLKIENSSVLVIGLEDSIEAIAQAGDIEFFRSVLFYLDTQKFWACQVTPVIMGMNESGVGDSSLVERQMSMVQQMTTSRLRTICEKFVEEVIKPIISFNWGEREDGYGEFQILEQSEESFNNWVSLLTDALRLEESEAANALIESLRKKLGV